MNFIFLKEILLVRYCVLSAYLIGSQVRSYAPTKDIDILFVVEKHWRIVAMRKMQEIQKESNFLFHPMFVDSEQYKNNPYYLKMAKLGIFIW